jgi:hypothetical protein
MESAEMSRGTKSDQQNAEPKGDGVSRVAQVEIADTDDE